MVRVAPFFDSRYTCMYVCMHAYIHTCEQILANNLHFSCVIGVSGFYPSRQLFSERSLYAIARPSVVCL